MNLFENTKVFSLVIVLSAFSLLFLVCSKDTSEPEEEPPAIPPTSAFIMDFTDFTSQDTTGSAFFKNLSANEVLSYRNWGWAATNVFIWNTLLTVGLAVPVASYVEAFNHEAVKQPDGKKWLWSYNFTVLGIMHTAELYGYINGDRVKWEMYISKHEFYSRFLWYYGYANLQLTQGKWTLNNNPNKPDSLLSIVWERNPDNSTAQIKYTNVLPEGPENGGYIHYGITTNTPYNAFYDVYNKGLNNHTNIEWNRATKEGRVSDLHHFQDTDWHCWGPNLEDVDCQ